MEVNKTEKMIRVKSIKNPRGEEECKNSDSFELSNIDSRYFGENPDNEARKLLDEAQRLMREDQQLQCDELEITSEIFNLRNSKIYLGGNAFARNCRPEEQIRTIFVNIVTLLNKGSGLDHCKAKLELDRTELKRRKCLLQKAIRAYESKKFY